MVLIDIAEEPFPTFFQRLTAPLSELWTFTFIHNYEKLIFFALVSPRLPQAGPALKPSLVPVLANSSRLSYWTACED